jgi:mannose/cellobiose epimerase-like protein (N-acyl-D-glucosamine 2-epimerase family)
MKATQWLQKDVLPLWLAKGIDAVNGGFIEALSFKDGSALDLPRRAMVQARQIYSLRLASDMGLLDKKQTQAIIAKATEFLLTHYSLPSGAFIHSVSPKGLPENRTPDLYGQAFALFGLAHSYAMNPTPSLEERAKALEKYLQTERSLPQGGFTELSAEGVMYEANPQMHLFEAAIAWMSVSSDPVWRNLADQLLDLCLQKFIDPQTGGLSEHFDSHWSPLLAERGSVLEPGHHYEWSWLMSKYEKRTGVDLGKVRGKLFELSEKFGVCPERKVVYDELWSDFSPKTKSSRFWTQCERIKCAADRGALAEAREAMESLLRYFETPVPGLWLDRMAEDKSFKGENAKASSLYHIIGAIAEYQNYV